MIKNTYLYGVVAIGLVAVLGIFVWRYVFISTPVAQAVISSVAVTPLEPLVQVVSEAGTVTELTARTEVMQGSRIRTSEHGRALIEGTHVTILDTNTELVVTAVTASGTRVFLEAGNVWARVEKTLDRGEYFEIETRDTVAAVRGTSFNVSVTASGTQAYVTEGQIILTPKNEDGVVHASAVPVVIDSGMMAEVSARIDYTEEMPDVHEIDPQIQETEWFEFNTPREDTIIPWQERLQEYTDKEQREQIPIREPIQDTQKEHQEQNPILERSLDTEEKQKKVREMQNPLVPDTSDTFQTTTVSTKIPDESVLLQENSATISPVNLQNDSDIHTRATSSTVPHATDMLQDTQASPLQYYEDQYKEYIDTDTSTILDVRTTVPEPILKSDTIRKEEEMFIR